MLSLQWKVPRPAALMWVGLSWVCSEGRSTVSAVKWAMFAFFTCRRGKSQRTGKQIYFLLLFFPSFLSFLFCAFTCMNKFFGLHVFYVLALSHSRCLFGHLFLYILCFVKFVSLFIHTWLGNRTQNTKQTTDNSKQRSGFELHAAEERWTLGFATPTKTLMDSQSQV